MEEQDAGRHGTAPQHDLFDVYFRPWKRLASESGSRQTQAASERASQVAALPLPVLESLEDPRNEVRDFFYKSKLQRRIRPQVLSTKLHKLMTQADIGTEHHQDPTKTNSKKVRHTEWRRRDPWEHPCATVHVGNKVAGASSLTIVLDDEPTSATRTILDVESPCENSEEPCMYTSNHASQVNPLVPLVLVSNDSLSAEGRPARDPDPLQYPRNSLRALRDTRNADMCREHRITVNCEEPCMFDHGQMEMLGNYPALFRSLTDLHTPVTQEINEWFISQQALDTSDPFANSRICVLSGPQGVGKSAVVYLASAAHAYRVFEVHPGSFCRSQKKLMDVCGELTESYTLNSEQSLQNLASSVRTLLLLEHVDHVQQDEERGFWKALTTLAGGNAPIVLTCDSRTTDRVLASLSEAMDTSNVRVFRMPPLADAIVYQRLAQWVLPTPSSKLTNSGADSAQWFREQHRLLATFTTYARGDLRSAAQNLAFYGLEVKHGATRSGRAGVREALCTDLIGLEPRRYLVHASRNDLSRLALLHALGTGPYGWFSDVDHANGAGNDLCSARETWSQLAELAAVLDTLAFADTAENWIDEALHDENARVFGTVDTLKDRLRDCENIHLERAVRQNCARHDHVFCGRSDRETEQVQTSTLAQDQPGFLEHVFREVAREQNLRATNLLRADGAVKEKILLLQGLMRSPPITMSLRSRK
ncbi:Telomere length regulation protein elg1 [Porphyridium purpureum]|uniref:Telomere length regulation protein elg1 n=1 Tax=Porphyridium purpureum TaxID=35688 RepID=A0A5J4Z6C8_PORPP|nr:Telomere length regulation protein elg1 [Porphyridium purpureum]|eukprot:POR8366..scf295_1